MKKYNRGTTIVEVVVSVSMLFVIVTFLFQIIISLKEVYNNSGIKTEMLNKQALINRIINDDLRNKKLEMALKCNVEGNCLSLYFEDGTVKNLEFIAKTDNTPAYLIYGDYKTELVEGSNFNMNSYEITSDQFLESNGINDSIMHIKIPITHPLLKGENYGINIIYQYNSKTTSITNLATSGNNGVDQIYLAGASNMIWYSTVDFVDPGYFYLDENKNLVKITSDDPSYADNDFITITSSREGNIETITYTSKTDLNVFATRTVTYLPSEEIYTYDSNYPYYVFSAPVSGTYNMQLWGANGASTTLGTGGIGAYTSGDIKLLAGEKVYVYIGSTANGDNGGYNGGGSITQYQSQNNGAAGGGATDIRLISGTWDNSASLESRIMVAAGGGGAKNSTCGSILVPGGAGGDIASASAQFGSSCQDVVWTLSYGANQTSGGSLDTYINSTKNNTYVAGTFGKAGSPTAFDGTITSGGGGGWYGGASSGYGSFGTGGSSFVSGCENCVARTQNGETAQSNIHYSNKFFTNYNMVAGNYIESNLSIHKPTNDNNGYAKIKLVSVSYGSNE